MESWRFLYTTLPNYKKAVTKTGAPILGRGINKYITTEGKDYSAALMKAKREGKFNEKQLLGSRRVS